VTYIGLIIYYTILYLIINLYFIIKYIKLYWESSITVYFKSRAIIFLIRTTYQQCQQPNFTKIILLSVSTEVSNTKNLMIWICILQVCNEWLISNYKNYWRLNLTTNVNTWSWWIDWKHLTSGREYRILEHNKGYYFVWNIIFRKKIYSVIFQKLFPTIFSILYITLGNTKVKT